MVWVPPTNQVNGIVCLCIVHTKMKMPSTDNKSLLLYISNLAQSFQHIIHLTSSYSLQLAVSEWFWATANRSLTSRTTYSTAHCSVGEGPSSPSYRPLLVTHTHNTLTASDSPTLALSPSSARPFWTLSTHASVLISYWTGCCWKRRASLRPSLQPQLHSQKTSPNV